MEEVMLSPPPRKMVTSKVPHRVTTERYCSVSEVPWSGHQRTTRALAYSCVSVAVSTPPLFPLPWYAEDLGGVETTR